MSARQQVLVPHQPLSFRESPELALRHTRAEAIDTRWSDAGFASADANPAALVTGRRRRGTRFA